MRKLNAILGMLILAIFLLHAFTGAAELIGFADGGLLFGKIMAWALVILIILHMIIGIKLTADTCIAIKRSGAHYFKDNLLFWTRRLSGFAMIAFIAAHYIVFIGKQKDGFYRLTPFKGPQLILSVLLIITLLLHILTNIRPLMIALGSRKGHRAIHAAAFVASVLLLMLGAAFVIYFIRWLS